MRGQAQPAAASISVCRSHSRDVFGEVEVACPRLQATAAKGANCGVGGAARAWPVAEPVPRNEIPVRLTSVGKDALVIMQAPEVGLWAQAEGPALVRLAYVLTGDADDAQDIVQSVLLRLLQADLARVGDLNAYARRAISNEFITQQRRRTHLGRLLPKLVAVNEPMEVEPHIAHRQALLGALATLSPKQRAAIVLRYFEDYTDEATGDVLGCSAATVRSLVARALPKLRTFIELAG